VRAAAAFALLVLSVGAAALAVRRLVRNADEGPRRAPAALVVSEYGPPPGAVPGAAADGSATSTPIGAPEARRAPETKRVAAPAEKRGEQPALAPAPPPPPPLPRVEIPAIGVRAHIVSLGLTKDGALQAPPTYDEVGWWSGGPRPGRKGPALLAGHVDSRSAPAVFYRLRELRSGDAVTVIDSAGSHRFRVTGEQRAGKASFPTRRVYGDTPKPALRLVTCGGPWDARAGHYRDNLIVYAKQA
jgi:sortase (surface protein transpeptidase)